MVFNLFRVVQLSPQITMSALPPTEVHTHQPLFLTLPLSSPNLPSFYCLPLKITDTSEILFVLLCLTSLLSMISSSYHDIGHIPFLLTSK